jgi:glycosyltransferase involved in cell wall biosynthesis
MAVVVIHASRDSGGIANASVSHAHGLICAGVPTELWTASESAARLARSLDVPVVEHIALVEPLLPLLTSQLWRRCNRIGTVNAVLHQSAKSRAWGWTMWPNAVHAVRFPNRKLRSRRLYKNWLAMSTRHAETLSAERTLGLIKHRVAIVRNGASQTIAQININKRTFRADGRFIIGGLGALCRRKGQDLLIVALKKLRDQGIDAYLRLGGEGESEQDLRNQADALGMTNYVEMLGWVEAPAFLASLDVFCLPSRHEPFGIVVVEALAMGLPIVASDTYGPSNILEDGSGIIIPIDDAEALTNELARLANDRALAEKLSNAATARSQNAYAPEAVGRQLIAAFRQFGADMPVHNPAKTNFCE